MTGRFKNSRFGGASDSEDVNPMDGLSNLADVMLVLAVGFMLALVINWNIDVSPKDSVVETPQAAEEISELDGFGDSEEKPLDGDVEYEDMGSGRIYRDPATGKYYLVTEDTANETMD